MKFLQKFCVIFSLLVAVIVCQPSQADADYNLYSRQGKFDVGLGAGMTVNSPIHFALEMFGEYFYTNNISIGAAFDVWIRSPHIFLFRPFARYHFDISRFPKFVPYIGGGIGGGADSHGNGALDVVVPNFGFKYAVTNNFYLGSDLALHILTDFDDTDIDFHLLFVTASFRF